MKNKAVRRRYRLHERLKRFTRIDARTRSVFVTEPLLTALSRQQLVWLNEIKDKHGYNVQFEIK